LCGSPKRWWVALAAFTLALFAKPAAVAAPLAALCLEWFALGRPARQALRALWPWFALAALWTLLTRGIQQIPPELAAFYPPWWQRPLVAGDALLFYAGKVLWPVGLAPIYGRTPAQVLAGPWPYLALVTSCVLAGAALWRRTLWGACLALFAAGLLPVLGLAPFLHQIYSTVADRYVYLAMLGVALAAALLYGCAAPRWPRATRLAAVLLLLILGLLGWRQAGHWRNTETLWTHSARVAPRAAVVHTYLGVILNEKGQTEQAMKEYETAIALEPRSPEAHNNLATIYLSRKQLDKAIEHYRRSVEALPRHAAAHANLADALARAGQAEQARAEYEEAYRLDPSAMEARLRAMNKSLPGAQPPRRRLPSGS
jgi:tetratricopeptide (TPR) repeat protein